jgi:hypothetical protein
MPKFKLYGSFILWKYFLNKVTSRPFPLLLTNLHLFSYRVEIYKWVLGDRYMVKDHCVFVLRYYLLCRGRY